MDGIDADVSLAHGIANFVVNGLVWTEFFFLLKSSVLVCVDKTALDFFFGKERCLDC